MVAALILTLPDPGNASTTFEAGTVLGYPENVSGGNLTNSVGMSFTYSWSRGDVGKPCVSFLRNSFANTDDDGSTAYTAVVGEYRPFILNRSQVQLFGLVGFGLHARSRSYSTEVRSQNPLIPERDIDISPGFSFGTGIAYRLLADSLQVVSTQRLQAVQTEPGAQHYWQVTLGLGWSWE